MIQFADTTHGNPLKTGCRPKIRSMDKNLSLGDSIFLAASFVLLLWVIKLGESMLGINLYQLGVNPQHPGGLMGVAVAPLIHGSWQHLIGNTLPILLLGSMLLYGYPTSRWRVLAIVWVVSGLGVWLLARSSYHIGASGITHGLFFFLFFAGILRRDKRSSALLMIAFFMYGTMFWTIFPREPDVSFEYHFCGAVSGTVCAFLFRHRDPKPERKTYSWEHESADDELEEDDPIIGDQWRTGLNGASDSSGNGKMP